MSYRIQNLKVSSVDPNDVNSEMRLMIALHPGDSNKDPANDAYDLIKENAPELEASSEDSFEDDDWLWVNEHFKVRLVDAPADFKTKDGSKVLEFKEYRPPMTQFGPEACLRSVLPKLATWHIIENSQALAWEISKQPVVESRMQAVTERLDTLREAQQAQFEAIFTKYNL